MTMLLCRLTAAASRLRPARLVGATVALALVPALAAAPAQAGELRYRDATHDVQKIDLASQRFELVPDPEATNGDIKDVFVHYRKGRLVIRANYVALKPSASNMLSYTGMIVSDAHRRWVWSVDTTFGTYTGHDELRTLKHFRRACEIGHLINYRHAFTRVVVPLDCLGDPRWVKVSVGALTVHLDAEALQEFFESAESDDLSDLAALPEGVAVLRADDSGQPAVADQLRLTPRVYR